ncbi:hypothetical protein CDD82_5569 [Ophiocordyceps australis]|uniref:Uncharacterized protein n=1 Tax=Ophiocordyceps australis TaxID=1399860 RepID=A0A2C5Z232_9HYPO|nr:hypothetical protein CDD82_5569 [Ophiocordyceps australis]
MRRIVLLLLVLLGTAVAEEDLDVNDHKELIYKMKTTSDPWARGQHRFVAYGATMFSRPNCTGWIDKGPYTNFGCNDRCYFASGAMSVMLEGDYYRWFPRFVGMFFWRASWTDALWAKRLFPGVKWGSEQDGPMVFSYDFSECRPDAIMDRVTIPNGASAICYTFTKPVYSFNLKLQRLCDYQAELSDGGAQKKPRKGVMFDEGDEMLGDEAWSGDGPKMDGRPAPPNEVDVPGENDTYARPPHMHGGTGPGLGMRRWTLGEHGDWGREEREAREREAKESLARERESRRYDPRELMGGGMRQQMSQDIKNEVLQQRFFDDWMRPEWEEDKTDALTQAYSRAPGVIWGDMSRDQVGFWGTKWEKHAPGNAAKKTYEAAVLGYAQCKKCYKETKKQMEVAFEVAEEAVMAGIEETMERETKESRKEKRLRKEARRRRRADRARFGRRGRGGKRWLDGVEAADGGNTMAKGPWTKTKPQWKRWA